MAGLAGAGICIGLSSGTLEARWARIFASADWADGWRGFVDGAIERGQQAARNVVALLRSQAGIKRPEI